jgi:hypothetical protein
VRETLLQRFDGGIFVVGPSGPFQKPKQQHTGSTLFADSQADGAQDDAECCLAFAFALTVVDVQLTMAAFAAICGSDNADASGHGAGSYRWSLTTSLRFIC